MPAAETTHLPHSATLLLNAACVVRRAHQRLEQLLAAPAERASLSVAEVLLVWFCRPTAENAASQLELAERAGISAAQGSALLERLRKRGLVIAQRCASDRRRQTWTATPAGNEIVSAIETELAATTRIDTSRLHLALSGLTALLEGFEPQAVSADVPATPRLFVGDLAAENGPGESP